MRRLLVIIAITTLALAKPESYREKEDFQFSRSSSDEGSKSGYYGAQRGNMGGNYEKAHNMDGLAQHQMSGLVKQVEGELGDGYKMRTGSVFTSANSRGIYGSGKYDLSNLKGRNFAEGESYGDSQSHSSLSQNAAFGGQSSSASSGGFTGSSLSQSYRHKGYQAAGHSDQFMQTDDLHSANNFQNVHGYEYGNQAQQYSQSGLHTQSTYDQDIANLGHSNGFVTNSHHRLVNAMPVRVVVRPGTRVVVPDTTIQIDDAAHHVSNSDISHINSEAEVLSNIGQQVRYRPSNSPKYYESSHSYRKEWEKHDTQPVILPVPIPTVNPFPKNSEIYDESQKSHESDSQHHVNADSYNTRLSNSAYTANTKTAAASTSRYQAGYNAQHRSTSSAVDYNALQNSASSAGDSNTYFSGTRNTDAGNSANLVELMNTKPKSYHSSYSYHKSWERQGDPYVIKPASNGAYDVQASQKLTAASSNQGGYTSHHYGSQYSQGHHSFSQNGIDCDCDEEGHVRVARSYDADQAQEFVGNQQNIHQGQDELGQQVQSNWENLGNLGQYSQGVAEHFKSLDQQPQNPWDHLQNFGQQTNEKLEDLGQQTQGKLEDLGQQTQNQWDHLQNFGQQTNEKLEDLGQQTQGKLEDLGQQTQNQWDHLQNFGQQTNEKLEDLGQQTQGKLEDLGQQTQNQWDHLQNFGQQTNEKLEDLGQQTQGKREDLGQQTQNQWDHLQNFGQQTNEKFEDLGQKTQGKLENLGQQTQNQWDHLQNFGQQTNEKLEDLGQQTQNQWDHIQNFRQQGNEKLEDLGQQSEIKWDNFQDFSQQTQENNENFGKNTWGKLEDLQLPQRNKDNKRQQDNPSQWDKLEHDGHQTRNLEQQIQPNRSEGSQGNKNKLLTDNKQREQYERKENKLNKTALPQNIQESNELTQHLGHGSFISTESNKNKKNNYSGFEQNQGNWMQYFQNSHYDQNQQSQQAIWSTNENYQNQNWNEFNDNFHKKSDLFVSHPVFIHNNSDMQENYHYGLGNTMGINPKINQWNTNSYTEFYNNFHSHYDSQHHAQQNASSLDSLWGKLDGIAKEILTEDDDKDSDQNKQNQKSQNRVQHHYLNNSGLTRSQEHSSFDLQVNRLQTAKPKENINTTKKPKTIHDSYTETNAQPIDMGRGDIGPEDTLLPDMTENSDSDKLSTSIFSQAVNPNKSPEEIEALSLAQKNNGISTISPTIKQISSNDLNEKKNTEMSNTFNNYSLKDQKISENLFSISSTTPKINNNKQQKNENNKQISKLDSEFIHSKPMFPNYNIQINSESQQKQEHFELEPEEIEQQNFDQQFDFNQQPQDLQDSSALKDFGQLQTFQPQDTFEQVETQQLQNFETPINEHKDIQHSYQNLHSNVEKINKEIEQLQVIPKGNNSEDILVPAEPTEKPGFWKSIGTKLTNAKDKVYSWFEGK